MLVEIIYIVGMVGVIACNGVILVAQYQLRQNSKTSVNAYVASLSVSAIIFACLFGPTVVVSHYQTLVPPTSPPVPPSIGYTLFLLHRIKHFLPDPGSGFRLRCNSLHPAGVCRFDCVLSGRCGRRPVRDGGACQGSRPASWWSFP